MANFNHTSHNNFLGSLRRFSKLEPDLAHTVAAKLHTTGLKG
jgi:hypothetical protein